MGMYNELNNIKRAVDQQAVEIKRTQEHQKRVEYVKNELKSMLQNELMDIDNIYNDDAKATAIENVLNNTIILLYNKDFTRQFLNDKYYTVARQVEQIKKKTETKDDYRQKIALEKWEIQRQREKLKIQLEAEKLKQLQQKQSNGKKSMQVQNKSFGYYLYKIIKFLLIGALAIIGGFVWMVISAATKNK